MSLGEMHTLSVLRGSSQNTFLRVCNLIPVAHIIPAELKGDREWAGSHYFQVRVAHCHCSPNRTPAESWGEHECWWRLEMNDMLSVAHLSVVHYCQRRGLTADDTDSHFVLQAAGHSAGCGLVRCGARTHLTAVVVAPCIHLADRKLKVRSHTNDSNDWERENSFKAGHCMMFPDFSKWWRVTYRPIYCQQRLQEFTNPGQEGVSIASWLELHIYCTDMKVVSKSSDVTLSKRLNKSQTIQDPLFVNFNYSENKML